MQIALLDSIIPDVRVRSIGFKGNAPRITPLSQHRDGKACFVPTKNNNLGDPGVWTCLVQKTMQVAPLKGTAPPT